MTETRGSLGDVDGAGQDGDGCDRSRHAQPGRADHGTEAIGNVPRHTTH